MANGSSAEFNHWCARMNTKNCQVARPRPQSRTGCSSCGSSIRLALTLVELLVVIAIIGALMALVIPAVRSARATGGNASCKNNLRQIGLALEMHANELKKFPTDGENGYGICAFILPFIEQQPLYHRLKPTSLPRQIAVARSDLGGMTISTLLCPAWNSRPKTMLELGRGTYMGTRELFPWKCPPSSVRDAKSNTISVGEIQAEQAWALPGTADALPPQNPDGVFGSRHPGGANFVFCDGSVHFIGDDVDPAVFKALCTINEGDAAVGW
jgi:prepilin-type processing-associated H-X9-DG protein